MKFICWVLNVTPKVCVEPCCYFLLDLSTARIVPNRLNFESFLPSCWRVSYLFWTLFLLLKLCYRAVTVYHFCVVMVVESVRPAGYLTPTRVLMKLQLLDCSVKKTWWCMRHMFGLCVVLSNSASSRVQDLHFYEIVVLKEKKAVFAYFILKLRFLGCSYRLAPLCMIVML